MGEKMLEESYKGAWTEICARLQSRQNTHLAHMTVVLGIFGYLSSRDTNVGNLIWFSAAVPTFTLCVALWSRHNDTTIGFLSAVCQSCEKYADPGNSSGIPMFHRPEQMWMKHALNYRRFSDMAFGIACLIALTPSVVISLNSGSSDGGLESFKLFFGSAFSISIATVSFLIIWSNDTIRRELHQKYQFKQWNIDTSKGSTGYSFSNDGSQPKEAFPTILKIVPYLFVVIAVSLLFVLYRNLFHCV